MLSIATLAAAAAAATAADGGTATWQWEGYKRAFNKAYEGGPEEDHRRRGIFEHNLAQYAELSALEPLARYGPTRLSDISPAEYLGGYKPSLMAAPELVVDRAVRVPAARDWTGKYTSPIKDQGSCGGCVGRPCQPDLLTHTHNTQHNTTQHNTIPPFALSRALLRSLVLTRFVPIGDGKHGSHSSRNPDP